MDNTADCPDCGQAMLWDKLDLEWVCPCGNVYTDEELDEERARIEAGE